MCRLNSVLLGQSLTAQTADSRLSAPGMWIMSFILLGFYFAWPWTKNHVQHIFSHQKLLRRTYLFCFSWPPGYDWRLLAGLIRICEGDLEHTQPAFDQWRHIIYLLYILPYGELSLNTTLIPLPSPSHPDAALETWTTLLVALGHCQCGHPGPRVYRRGFSKLTYQTIEPLLTWMPPLAEVPFNEMSWFCFRFLKHFSIKWMPPIIFTVTTVSLEKNNNAKHGFLLTLNSFPNRNFWVYRATWKYTEDKLVLVCVQWDKHSNPICLICPFISHGTK